MSTLLQLREKRAKLKEDVEAPIALAEKEERDLTDEERGKIKGCLAEADTLKSDIEDRERFEELDKEINTVEPQRVLPNQPDQPRQTEKRIIPAMPYRCARLRHFKGPDAERRAYVSGMWIQAVLFGNGGARNWCQKNGVEIRALSEGVNTAGGYLVPEEFSSAIINLREERGVFRREARIVPMGSDTMTLGRRTGGLTAYAVGEGDTLTESDKSWDRVSLTARKWAVRTRWSTELDQDAVINLADDMAEEIAYALADKEDESGFNGDGTSTYHGIFGVIPKVNDGNHAGSIYDAASGNTAFSTLDLVDFEGLVGQLPQYAEANAKWYISKIGFWASMARLVDAQGGNTMDHIAGGPARQFLGYPVVFSQVLNTTLTAQASTIVCFLGDLNQAAMLGDRRGITVNVSNEVHWATDEIGIKATQRYDINVHELGGASVAGSLIAMKTAAS